MAAKTASEHGDSRRYQLGCRCPACTSANRDRLAEWRDRVRGSAPSHVHGSVNGYTNWACRCAECTEAMRVHMADRRAKARA